MQSEQSRDAMAAAKRAVRAYARDPSSSNAAEVELAWHWVRRLKSVAEWRRPSIGRAPSPSSSSPSASGGSHRPFDEAI
jgi:hypothetical protein